MNLDFIIGFCGWTALTYFWLHTNWVFFETIGEAIQRHNDSILSQER